jgi:Sds3-like
VKVRIYELDSIDRASELQFIYATAYYYVGTHPELIHLLAELSKRRDKRLELASRKRAYEIANVTKKRVLEENATWSWWKASPLGLKKNLT